MKQLVLHIGYTKTGTTAVQNHFERYFSPDEKTGFWCPATKLTGGRYKLAVEAGGDATRATPAWDLMKKSVETTPDWRTLFLSIETFIRCDPKRVSALVDQLGTGLAPHVIVYLRPHASWLISDYLQNAKIGRFDKSLRDYMVAVRGNLHFAEVLAPWRAEFGDRLHVKPFMRDQLDKTDIVWDIIKTMSEWGARAPAPADKLEHNTSPSVSDIALRNNAMRAMEGLSQPQRNKLAAPMRLEDESFSAHSSGISDELLEELRETCIEDARLIDARYFDAPLFETHLKDYKSCGTPLDTELHTHFTNRELQIIQQYNLLVERMSRQLSGSSEVPSNTLNITAGA